MNKHPLAVSSCTKLASRFYANIAEIANTVVRMNSGKIAEIYTNETQKTAYEIGW